VPGTVEIDPYLGGGDTRQRLLHELRQMLQERRERWDVWVRMPISHSLWEVRIKGPGYANNAWLSAAAQAADCIIDLVRFWLAEFDHLPR
jgi:hypothetical protein